jgi:hypothetical protein
MYNFDKFAAIVCLPAYHRVTACLLCDTSLLLLVCFFHDSEYSETGKQNALNIILMNKKHGCVWSWAWLGEQGG